MRRNAIIVFTALIQRFLITYRFSFVLVICNSVLNAESMSHGCWSAHWAVKRLLQRQNPIEKINILVVYTF